MTKNCHPDVKFEKCSARIKLGMKMPYSCKLCVPTMQRYSGVKKFKIVSVQIKVKKKSQTQRV